jgi:Na+-transporting methylmalonyl-CoA/oxaloacetate decarboxylase beta subunit
MIGEIIPFYLMMSFYALILWPIIREIVSDRDERLSMIGRAKGETGAEYLLRALVSSLLWPITVLYISYLFLTRLVIPWLTTPKS